MYVLCLLFMTVCVFFFFFFFLLFYFTVQLLSVSWFSDCEISVKLEA